MNDQGYHVAMPAAEAVTDDKDKKEKGMGPIGINVEAGKTYYWCSCGRSTTQPFCSGAHRGSAQTPVDYLAARSGQVFFCTCKRSAKAPLCDGTHKTPPPSASA